MIRLLLNVILTLIPTAFTATSSSAPIITIGLRNLSVPIGHRAQLFCEAGGFPKPKVKIYRSRRPVRISDYHVNYRDIDHRLKLARSYKLISSMGVSDEGWYYCKTKNRFGFQIVRSYVSIRDPCSTYKCPQGKECQVDPYTRRPSCRCPVRECDDFDIVCGSDCHTYFSPCYLEVRNCETDSNITISYKGFCGVPQTPKINYWQKNVTVALGQPINLTCNAYGDPKPRVKWFHKIEEDSVAKVVAEDDNLYLPSASLLDSGIYFCQAETCGDYIAQSNNFNIRVEPPPVLPTCVIAGNGHVRTFDSQSYSFGGRCSYMLARHCDKSDWGVYGRFGSCQVNATCIEAITIHSDVGNSLFEIGRGWSVNMGYLGYFTMGENDVREFSELGLTLRMNGTHLHVDLTRLLVIWDGVTTAHIVLKDQIRNIKTCGMCGGNFGRNHYRSRMLSHSEAYSMVESSRLDYYHQCAPSYLQNYVCKGIARTEAIEMCKSIFSCPGFTLCKQVIDVAWYMSTCIYDACTKEYLHAYPSPCRASAAFSDMCGIAGFDVSECDHPQCNIKNVMVGSHCPENQLPFRGCGPTL